MTPLLYKYSEPELKRLLKTLTVICDTRKQKTEHITAYFESRKIPHMTQTLSFGDYSYMIPVCQEFGITRKLYFTDSLVIERKNSLEELSGNLAQHRLQFENEFLRAGKAKIILMVESGSYVDIYRHKYKTQLSEKAYIASLMALTHRYNINLSFVDIGSAAAFIYQNCYYHAREFLK